MKYAISIQEMQPNLEKSLAPFGGQLLLLSIGRNCLAVSDQTS